jgi:hypothetical protein
MKNLSVKQAPSSAPVDDELTEGPSGPFFLHEKSCPVFNRSLRSKFATSFWGFLS